MTEEEFEDIKIRVAKLEGGQMRMSDKLDYNNKITEEVASKIDTLLDKLGDLADIVVEGRGAFKLFSRLMKVFRWMIKYMILPLLALFGAIYSIKSGSELPSWMKEISEWIK